MLRQPDHPGAIDEDLVVPVPGFGVEILPLCTGARIQFDQPMRNAAIHEPDVAICIESGVLSVATDPISGPLGIISPLPRRVSGQVILDVHGLAEGLFVDRRLLFDLDAAGRAVGSEVLDHIRQQVVPVLPTETEHRGPEGQQPLPVSRGILFPECAADHVVDARHPLPLGARTRGKEVLAVTHHAHLLGNLLARSRRIDFVVALVDDGARRGVLHRGPAGRNDERWRIAVELAHREVDLGGVPGGHHDGVRVRFEMLGAGTDLVAAGKQRDGAKASRIRVDHVHDSVVDVTNVDLGRRERLRGRDGSRQSRRSRNFRLQSDSGQDRHAQGHGKQPGAGSECSSYLRTNHWPTPWTMNGIVSCRECP